MPQYSPLHDQALQFIKEHGDLCDALLRRAEEFAYCLEDAERLRETVTRLVLALRQAVRQFAARNVCDETRLLKSVSGILRWRAGLQGHAGQILRRCSKRAWQLEQLYGEGNNFEVDTIDERLFRVLRVHRSVNGAAKLRDWMRAIARHYARLTGSIEAVRFLRDLAGELDSLS